jgi:hypothetical protein
MAGNLKQSRTIFLAGNFKQSRTIVFGGKFETKLNKVFKRGNERQTYVMSIGKM